MSWIRIGKGIAKIWEGVSEGDVGKIIKGVYKVVTGIIFALMGKKDDSDDSVDD